jgi:hypothetical protein
MTKPCEVYEVGYNKSSTLKYRVLNGGVVEKVDTRAELARKSPNI